jgi:hypothetical protein
MSFARAVEHRLDSARWYLLAGAHLLDVTLPAAVDLIPGPVLEGPEKPPMVTARPTLNASQR